MPELRKDPIVGRWVIIAPDRAKRPQDEQQSVSLNGEGFDPFLEGNESVTPGEILAYRKPGTAPDEPGWRVRVVPNKFPALQVEGSVDKREEGLYERMNGVGAHEVIVECPHRERNMSRLSVENIREVFWIYRDRLLDLKKDPRLLHGLIFKNKGAAAGASLDHSHSQLIVTSVVPISVQEALHGAREFYDDQGRCVYEDIIQHELSIGSRVVLDTPHFVVLCPYASRFPFETWVLPKQHSSHFEEIARPALDDLGTVMKTVLRKLEIAVEDPPYNYVLHTAPFNAVDLPHYLWHLEIYPRLTQVAGFEWGSGFYINPVPPEEAAALLRDVPVDQQQEIRQTPLLS